MRGIYGRTSLFDLPFFDVTTMIPVEIMHTLDGGVIEYFLRLWTRKGGPRAPEEYEARVKAGRWTLSNEQIDELTRRIRNVRLPNWFTDKPDLCFLDRWKSNRKSC
jgi:hypothetical protein